MDALIKDICRNIPKAIAELHEPKGSSRIAIKKWYRSNEPKLTSLDHFGEAFNRAIQQALAKKLIKVGASKARFRVRKNSKSRTAPTRSRKTALHTKKHPHPPRKRKKLPETTKKDSHQSLTTLASLTLKMSNSKNSSTSVSSTSTKSTSTASSSSVARLASAAASALAAASTPTSTSTSNATSTSAPASSAPASSTPASTSANPRKRCGKSASKRRAPKHKVARTRIGDGTGSQIFERSSMANFVDIAPKPHVWSPRQPVRTYTHEVRHRLRTLSADVFALTADLRDLTPNDQYSYGLTNQFNQLLEEFFEIHQHKALEECPPIRVTGQSHAWTAVQLLAIVHECLYAHMWRLLEPCRAQLKAVAQLLPGFVPGNIKAAPHKKKKWSDEEIQKIIKTQISSYDESLERMKKTFAKAEVEALSANLKLFDVLSLSRLTSPARGAKCQHRGAFELTTFLNQKYQRCPICHKHVSTKRLYIDGFISEIIANTSENVREVIIDKTGKWSLPKTHKPPDTVIDISDLLSDDDDDDVQMFSPVTWKGKTPPKSTSISSSKYDYIPKTPPSPSMSSSLCASSSVSPPVSSSISSSSSAISSACSSTGGSSSRGDLCSRNPSAHLSKEKQRVVVAEIVSASPSRFPSGESETDVVDAVMVDADSLGKADECLSPAVIRHLPKAPRVTELSEAGRNLSNLLLLASVRVGNTCDTAIDLT